MSLFNGIDTSVDPEGYSGIHVENYNDIGSITIASSVAMGNAKHGIYFNKANAFHAFPMDRLPGTSHSGIMFLEPRVSRIYLSNQLSNDFPDY